MTEEAQGDPGGIRTRTRVTPSEHFETLRAAVKRRDPMAVARLLAHGTRWPAPRKFERGSVVGLKKTGFDDDLRTALNGPFQPTVAFLARSWLKEIARCFLPDGIGDFDFASDIRLKDSDVAEHELFLAQVLVHYFDYVGSKRIVTGNFVYWAEQSLQASARSAGGAFLVLHKEAIVAAWPRTAAAYRRSLEFGVRPFRGDGLAVYSQAIADLLQDAKGIDSLSPQPTVVGAPRLDLAHRYRREGRPRSGAKQVTFFTFANWSGFGFPGDPRPDEVPTALASGWNQTAHGVAEAVHILARNHTDVRIVVKVKQGHQSDPMTLAIEESIAALPETRRRMIEIVAGGNGGQLARESDVCVAMNSTVALEAVAAGTPLVVPQFGEAALAAARAATLDMGDSATRATSPAEMAREVARLASMAPERRRRLTAGDEALLDTVLGNPDGLASRRVRRFVNQFRT
jgi:hypothetical protein